MASGAIALVVAALTFGVASAVLRPASSPLAVPSGSAFTITSAIYPSPACSGSTALLYPGVTDCAVLTVHNNLTVPITVQSLSTTIPSPPAGCPASNFSLPTFTGSLAVPASGAASTSGLSISLIDTGTNQDACKNANINFAYSGSAQYTDATTTVLAASSTTPISGQSVTLTATVAGANASTDPSTPTGDVTFNSCPTSDCSSTTALGTGTLGSSGVATLSTSSLTPGVHYVQAAYPGSGTDYMGSTSNVITLTVASPVTSPGSSQSGPGTSGGTSSGATTKPATVAFTGADIAGMVAGGLVLIGAGTLLVVATRRRRRAAQS